MSSDILIQCFSDEDILQAAATIMERRVRNTTCFDSPGAVRKFLQYSIGAAEREHFSVMFLDSQHRMIETEVMFSGTVNATSVYPREVVKRALSLNSASVIFCHNHPSGILEPSRADEMLTQQLKTALALVDVRVLDHIIVSSSGSISFAERGLL